MQLSYFYRRGILSAQNEDAQTQLDSWDIQHPILVEFLSLNDDSDYDRIWDLGLFQAINSTCGSMIDEYEETVIEASKLNSIIDLIDNKFQNVDLNKTNMFLKAFRELVINARDNNRSIYFIL